MPVDVSGAIHAASGTVPLSSTLQIAQSQLFNLAEVGLLVVYDARFKDAKIYGHIGGYEMPDAAPRVFN